MMETARSSADHSMGTTVSDATFEQSPTTLIICALKGGSGQRRIELQKVQEARGPTDTETTTASCSELELHPARNTSSDELDSSCLQAFN